MQQASPKYVAVLPMGSAGWWSKEVDPATAASKTWKSAVRDYPTWFPKREIFNVYVYELTEDDEYSIGPSGVQNWRTKDWLPVHSELHFTR